MLKAEAIAQEELEGEASNTLHRAAFDYASKLEELETAERKRDAVLQTESKSEAVAILFGGLFYLSLIVLLFVGIAKWTGHLLKAPLSPWVALAILFFVLASAIGSIGDLASQRRYARASVLAESLSRSLRQQLRSLVIIPAIDRVIPLKFTAPADDVVSVTDAPALSSLAGSDSRIQTESYRDVFVHLGRDGGATVGLAGSRGAGKSELLRAFCQDPSEGKSVKEGGVIGIIIPAPVAYEAKTFLRLLIRRLAEEVPDYHKHAASRIRVLPSVIANYLILMLAVASLAAGLYLIFGMPNISRHIAGWALIALSTMAAVWLLARLTPSLKSLFRTLRESSPYSFVLLRGNRVDPAARGARINRQQREKLAVTAVRVVQRVRYVETRSMNLQASASWQNFGLKKTSGVKLDQIPLTEPELVSELSDLVRDLNSCGYEVRIGIDELDKLVAGDDAESFLTGIKVLFSIPGCSFILTISENASAQFARRGMPVRDVFDSSLDAVVVVQPLTFREAKRLMRARLRRGRSEEISDSQALLCYCFAGGLPREFIRFCRQLGEFNSKLGRNRTLADVLDTLSSSEVSARLDGVRSALRSRDEGSVAAKFIAELEIIDDAHKNGRTLQTLSKFLASDRVFAALSRPVVGGGSLSTIYSETDIDWIRDTRRQLYSYLYFVQTVREAFDEGWRLTGAKAADEAVPVFELIADARRQVEGDAAAGWRRVAEARLELGLTLITWPDFH